MLNVKLSNNHTLVPTGIIQGRTKKSIFVAVRVKDEECGLVEIFDGGTARLARRAPWPLPYNIRREPEYAVSVEQKLRLRWLVAKGASIMGIQGGEV